MKEIEMPAVAQFKRQMKYVVITTFSLLLVPLLAMQLTLEVDWDLIDFIVMGVLLFGTGTAYVIVSQFSENTKYRIAVGIAVLAAFLLIWANLAVGIIGSENNPANLMYIGVLVIAAAGVFMARFQPRGMAYAMGVTALSQMLVPLIVFFFRPSAMDEPPGITGVFIGNAFFAVLFVISGSLFWRNR